MTNALAKIVLTAIKKDNSLEDIIVNTLEEISLYLNQKVQV